MKTLNINKTPNYYLIIMEDGGRRRLSAEGGLGSVGAVRVHTYVGACGVGSICVCGVCVSLWMGSV